jgi:hypothetical protein
MSAIAINTLAIHTVVDGLVSLGMFCLSTRQFTGMRTGNWLLVPLPLKHFLTAFHLGVIPILDLEPRCSFCHIVPVPSLRHNSFQIQLADTFKQRGSAVLNVFDVPHPGIMELRHQPPEFVLAVCQSLCPDVLAVSHQEIECKETRMAPVREQIVE